MIIISPKFTLKAHERLKSRKLIRQLFDEGKSFSHFPLRINYIISDDQTSPLLAGFSVSKRHFKKAVDRNKIKRLMREAYRLQKNSLKELLVKNNKSIAVFFIYTGKDIPNYKDVFEKIGSALGRFESVYGFHP